MQQYFEKYDIKVLPTETTKRLYESRGINKLEKVDIT